MTYEPPKVWMGAEIPSDIQSQWLGPGGHYWRRGVIDSLQVSVAYSGDLAQFVKHWAKQEREDRMKRVEARG